VNADCLARARQPSFIYGDVLEHSDFHEHRDSDTVLFSPTKTKMLRRNQNENASSFCLQSSDFSVYPTPCAFSDFVSVVQGWRHSTALHHLCLHSPILQPFLQLNFPSASPFLVPPLLLFFSKSNLIGAKSWHTVLNYKKDYTLTASSKHACLRSCFL